MKTMTHPSLPTATPTDLVSTLERALEARQALLTAPTANVDTGWALLRADAAVAQSLVALEALLPPEGRPLPEGAADAEDDQAA